MNKTIGLVLLAILLVPQVASAQQQWSQGYWTPWGNPALPPAAIEWGGLTHVVHAWALVKPDGTLDLSTQRINSDGPVLIANAHSHGVKALLGVGQPYWLGQTTNFQTAISSNRAALVNNIMNVVNSYGFDGVDLDWEPFSPSTNGGAMQAFAADLRARLGTTKTLSAAAIVSDYVFWGSVQSYFDRIGAMTYDMTGTWNPYSWHNAALFDTDGMVWSVDLAVRRFTASGVPASKLTIGIPFFGYRWSGGGVTGPRQTWSGTPNLQQTYYQNFHTLINAGNYRWDSAADVPYLSTDNAGTTSDEFFTYDNEQSIAEKVHYAENRALGGWIIWELSGDYVTSQSPNQPLLTAIKNARTPAADLTPPTVTISQSSGQLDPSGVLPINFTVTFSEPVSGFTASDVTVGGSALGTKTVLVTGSGASYNVTVAGVAGSGTVVASIAAAVATDAAGNPNTASTTSDNVVTYVAPDLTPPSATINQASGQADPVTAGPVSFTVTFSEFVTGFAASDVLVSGTAPGTQTVSVTGGGASYAVAIGGMTGSGTVIVSIPAGAALDGAGNLSLAATSSDNTVTLTVAAPASAQQQWSLGFWSPWSSSLPITEIEWAGLTHIVHGWALAQTNGALDLTTQRVVADGPTLVSAAHARGVKALLGVSQAYWLGQTSGLMQSASSSRAALVDNIVSTVNAYGFDGVELDWIPFDPAVHGEGMRLLATDLRARLGAKTLSTTAEITHFAYWGTVHDRFDRIGVRTYNLTGTWNPYSWHNAALYDPDGMVWSVDMAIRRFTGAGIPSGKLSIGLPFFGYKWTGGGVTGPQQGWSAVPALQQLNYAAFASSINAQNYRQDGVAKVPYLSIDSTLDANDTFITYDDAWSIKEKIDYVKSRGLGGWMISEIGSDYLPSQTPNQPLLAAVKNIIAPPPPPPLPPPPAPPAPPADTASPTVKINQASSQADPTSVASARFTVVFSEPVTGFTSADLSLGGTASGTKTVKVSGSGTTYDVTIGGITNSGTVTASVKAGAAIDAAGNLSLASTSLDNSVRYRRGYW